MRDHRPKLTESIIEGSQLSKIQSHAADINLLNRNLKTILPPNCVEYCRVANIRGGHLVIEVANASLKMKLDYDRLSLLSQLRQAGFSNLIGLEFRIEPSLYQNKLEEIKEAYPQKRAPLSEEAAQYLTSTAQGAPEKIKQRLLNIAALAGKKKNRQ
jgi:hypothetical protein